MARPIRGARPRSSASASRASCSAGSSSSSSGTATEPVLPLHLFSNRTFSVVELRRVHRRLRDVRRDHLPALLLPDRPRRVADHLGAAAAAAHGGPAGRVHRLWPVHQPDRPLPDLSHRRHRRRRPRAVPPLADGSRDEHAHRGLLHGRARHGPRGGDAGARARRPERGPLLRARGRHIGSDLLPLDRRVFRRRHLRGHLLERARRQSGAAISTAPSCRPD